MATACTLRTRTRRREACYPAQYPSCLPQETADTLESICHRHEMTMGTLLRRVVARELPPSAEALKSERKRAARDGAGSV